MATGGLRCASAFAKGLRRDKSTSGYNLATLRVALCRILFFTASSGLFLCAAGCRTLAPMPAVDLKAPGWTVREGQAVWKRPHGGPEIAGDVVVAWRDGSSFVQFSKSPFTLVVCQSTPRGWDLKVPVENLHYSRRGHAPKRIIWLQLPKVLAGGSPPKGWSWNMTPDNNWTLKNPKTGESIEGYFAE